MRKQPVSATDIDDAAAAKEASDPPGDLPCLVELLPLTRHDQTTIQRGRVVVDTYDGALAEAGDVILPLQAGAISREHLLADLHELVSGKKIRESDHDITIFKSVGCALEDLATAVLLRQQLST